MKYLFWFFVGAIIAMLIDKFFISHFYLVYNATLVFYILILSRLRERSIYHRVNFWRLTRVHNRLKKKFDNETNYRKKRMLFGREREVANLRMKYYLGHLAIKRNN